jgi:hypothetical protein
VLAFVHKGSYISSDFQTRYARWFEFAEKTRNPNNQAADFEKFTHNSIFAQMIHRLSVGHADNQNLIQEMGEEAYYAAKKLGEQIQKEEDEAFLYWSIYDKVDEKYRDQYNAEFKAERSKRFAVLEEKDALQKLLEEQKVQAAEKAAQAILVQNLLEKQKIEIAEAIAARKLLEKEQKLLEKEKAEAQKLLEKEKAEAQKLLEKEKAEAQKLLEKEKVEAQKLLEKEKVERSIAKKLLQEEQKKVKKLEKEQKKIAEKNQIQLIHTLFAAGLSVDAMAQLLQVPVQQILTWQKSKK